MSVSVVLLHLVNTNKACARAYIHVYIVHSL
jgi:hypothetical protein